MSNSVEHERRGRAILEDLDDDTAFARFVERVEGRAPSFLGDDDPILRGVLAPIDLLGWPVAFLAHTAGATDLSVWNAIAPDVTAQLVAALLRLLGEEGEHGAGACVRFAAEALALEDPEKRYRGRAATFALADALGRHVAAIEQACEWPESAEAALREEDGVLWLDALLADHLDTLGAVGATFASLAREMSRKRCEDYRKQGVLFPDEVPGPSALFRAWINPRSPGSCPAVVSLARAIWRAEVLPAFERRHALAIPRGVQRELALATMSPRGAVEHTERGARIIVAGAVVGRYEMRPTPPAVEAATLARIRRGAELARTATWERLLRFLIRRAHEPGRSAYDPMVFDRGIDGLAREMGVTSKREVERLLPILEAMQAYRGGERDIPLALNYWHRGAAPGRQATLGVQLGAALVPLYARDLPEGEARWLLPVLAAPSLPRDVGGDVHARLLLMQWEMLTEMRRRLEQIDVGWHLPQIVGPAADAVEVTRRDAGRAVAHWTQAADAWLRPVGPVRVTLGDERALATFRDAVESGKRAQARAIRKHHGRKR